jgi:hypothetical protein
MKIRTLAAAIPVAAALAVAGPVAAASAQTTSSTTSPTSAIPCYPYPAFCGPNGQPWFQWLPFPQSPIVMQPLPSLPLPVALPAVP